MSKGTRWSEEDYANYIRRRNKAVADTATMLALPEPAIAMIPQPTTDEAKLNKTEKEYLHFLRAMYRGEWIGVQCITLKLADDCRYSPDFWVLLNGTLYAREVKGFWRDDAKVKIKVAARMYPWIDFQVVTKSGDEFKHEAVKP